MELFVSTVDAVPIEGRDRDEDHHGDQRGHRDGRHDAAQPPDEG
jgi:hypothetical protein